MNWLGSGCEHHVSLGCQVVLLQLLHQESDHAGLGVTFTVTTDRLVLRSAGRKQLITAHSLRMILNEGMQKARLTSEGAPPSSALPSEPPAPERCTEAAWYAPAALQRHHLGNWVGKISTITLLKAPESAKYKNDPLSIP